MFIDAIAEEAISGYDRVIGLDRNDSIISPRHSTTPPGDYSGSSLQYRANGC